MSSAIAFAATTTVLDRAAFLASTEVAADPPPGVIPNFDAPNPNGTFLIVVGIIGLILTTMITAMRIWTKGFLMRTSGWDDYTCVLTLAAIYVWTVTNIELHLMGWGRHDYNIRATQATWQKRDKLEFIANNAYFVGIGSVKVSILLLYLRTFTGSKRFRYSVWVVLILVITSHVSGLAVYMAQFTPISCNWLETATDEEWYAHCKVVLNTTGEGRYYVFLNAFTVFLDLVILYLPCRPVWGLHLAKRQRIAIMMIILAGVVVTIASILRVTYLVHRFYGSDVDDSLSEFQVNLISTFELDLALFCCCLPILKPFMRQYMPNVLRLSSFATNTKQRSNIPAPSSLHPSKAGRKWPDGSRDEELIGSNYLELGEDGKSDQSYVMTAIPVKDGK